VTINGGPGIVSRRGTVQRGFFVYQACAINNLTIQNTLARAASAGTSGAVGAPGWRALFWPRMPVYGKSMSALLINAAPAAKAAPAQWPTPGGGGHGWAMAGPTAAPAAAWTRCDRPGGAPGGQNASHRKCRYGFATSGGADGRGGDGFPQRRRRGIGAQNSSGAERRRRRLWGRRWRELAVAAGSAAAASS